MEGIWKDNLKTFEMEVVNLDIETNDLYEYFEKSNTCTHKKTI